MRIKTILFTILGLLTLNEITGQNQRSSFNKTPFSIGETFSFNSSILNENRTINIYLPESYHPDSTHRYPVIYLLDGSSDEDFIHIAGLVQFGSFSWIKMIPESIVVGIANVDRKRDFTFPTTVAKDKKDYPTTGSSARFIDFIEKELQPLIQKEYRTDSIKTIIGQSLGGLLATEILFKKPEMFDNYIIISPSLWWDNESLLRSNPQKYLTHKSIYIGVGKEGTIMERDAKALFQKLKTTAGKNSRLFFGFFKKQDHGDALHQAVYDAFEKMFRPSGH